MTAHRGPTAAARSLAVFPAGSNGEYDLPPELTIVLARGQGATVWDAEGRAFTDFTMGWGSVLLGHAHPVVLAAVQRQTALGSNFACVTEPALALAEELVRAVACMFPNPMSTKLYLSLAHTEADIGRLLDAARAALRSA